MICPNCGKVLPDDSLFCMECGARQSGKTSREAIRASGRRPVVLYLVLAMVFAITAAVAIFLFAYERSYDTGKDDEVVLRTISPRAEPLYDADGIRIYFVICYPQHDDTYQALEFYIENNTDDTLLVKQESLTAGDAQMRDILFDERLMPESKGFYRFKVNRQELDDAGQLPMRDVEVELAFTREGEEEEFLLVPVQFRVF